SARSGKAELSVSLRSSSRLFPYAPRWSPCGCDKSLPEAGEATGPDEIPEFEEQGAGAVPPAREMVIVAPWLTHLRLALAPPTGCVFFYRSPSATTFRTCCATPTPCSRPSSRAS